MASEAFDVNMLIGGQAGQGMQTSGQLLAKSLLKLGFYISTLQSFHSRIRGGHNYYQIRLASTPINCMTRSVDVLLAFDENTLWEHQGELHADSLSIFNSEKIKVDHGKLKGRLLELSMSQVYPEAVTDEIFTNVVYVGVLAGLLNCPEAEVESVIGETFNKGAGVLEKNVAGYRAGRKFVQDAKVSNPRLTNVHPEKQERSLVLHGNEAIALGALAAGCRFYTAYPMTPASTILETMAHYMSQAQVVVEQAEDEIAALNMVLGASFAGVRAMTGTSGGGFSLMVEAVSLAGMLEIPAVIALAMRPGPATGLPTRTEQGDLEFAIHAGHGEFARVLLSPGTHAECFYQTTHAFNLADRYHVPVLVLTDQYLSDWYTRVPEFKMEQVTRDYGPMVEGKADYARYALTDNGVSPRMVPGRGEGLVVVDSDEHTQGGHLTEDLAVREKMVKKRLQKIEGLKREYFMPEVMGTGQDTLVMCWGSNRGVVADVVAHFQQLGKAVTWMHFKQVWPLPEERLRPLLSAYRHLVMVENNATGQFARVLQGETGVTIAQRILKYDGKPFLFEDLLTALEKLLV
ncbi:MAG: 2-oxoacid:acceptor oxidoreductase subunit alpha [Candidatus Firestonebacteria bacterium]|nr:2-oxoacid:acceptor oxidoreductase subunit alpha [Candidatus Firestonebacteria bacterium]